MEEVAAAETEIRGSDVDCVVRRCLAVKLRGFKLNRGGHSGLFVIFLWRGVVVYDWAAIVSTIKFYEEREGRCSCSAVCSIYISQSPSHLKWNMCVILICLRCAVRTSRFFSLYFNISPVLQYWLVEWSYKVGNDLNLLLRVRNVKPLGLAANGELLPLKLNMITGIIIWVFINLIFLNKYNYVKII